MLLMNTFAQRPSCAHLLDKLESVILWLAPTFSPNFRHELECQKRQSRQGHVRLILHQQRQPNRERKRRSIGRQQQ